METTSKAWCRRWLAPALTLLSLAPTSLAANPPDGWRITLTVSQPGHVDRGRLVLGASSVSADGYDTWDEPEPPAWPHHGLDIVTEHDRGQPGWETQPLPALRYRREFGAPLGPADSSREVVVAVTQPGSVTVTWQLSADLDLAEHYLELVDLQDGTRVDMWAVSQRAFAPASARHRFRIELRAGRSAPPIADDQELSTSEDTPLAVTLTATDPQGDPLSYALLTAPAHGTLLGTPPSLTYHPAPDFSGSDAFSFVASDAGSTSSPGAVTITVLPVNDAPSAQAQALETDEDLPLPVTLAGTDVDGDALAFELVTAPVHGTLSGTAPAVVYVPAPDWNGSDAFSFRASDGSLTSAPATVAIAVRPVNDPPRAAFGVPGPARNAATLDSNVGAYAEGASLAAVSSEAVGYPATNAIDDSASTTWRSASGQAVNQSLTVALPAGAQIDRVRLVNGQGTEAVKGFEVRVSVTTADASAFSTVLTGLALNNANTVQEFALPAATPASYVQLRVLDNWGSACCVSLRSFEAVSDALGGVPTYAGTPTRPASVSSYLDASSRPEALLDGDPATAWLTAVGAITNQHVEVRLEAEVLVDRVRLLGGAQGSTRAVRDFDVLVSVTTDEDSAFASVLTATNLNNGQVQEFAFPGGARPARYVRLVARNNHGHASNLSVATFEVVSVASEGSLVSANAGVVGFSSQANASSGPAAALDQNPAGYWRTAVGQTGDQWVKLSLPSGRAWLVDHVALQPQAACCDTQSARRFEVQISTTSADDSAFTTAFRGTLRNNRNLQHFFFDAVEARYVRLLLKDNYGGSTTDLQALAIYSPQIGSLEARFEDRSSDVDGAVVARAWDFGDGGASDERRPAHTFAAPGPYLVTLTASDGASASSSRTQPYEAVGRPAASFTASPAAPGEGSTVTFVDASVDASGVTLREWDFGDGSAPLVSSASSATHVFADNGTYSVRLRVTNSWSVSALTSRTVTVANLPPTVSMVSEKRMILGQEWAVAPLVSDPGSADAANLQCHWVFGDGQTADVSGCLGASARVPHTYAATGTYTATLTVTDKDGAATTASVTAHVFPPECALAPSSTFVEFPFCGNAYTIQDLGEAPDLPTNYSGLVVKHDDPDTLLIGANGTGPEGAIYAVRLSRDAGRHITGFAAPAVLYAPVPYIDGGLVYGPGNVLFTAAWPAQQLIQLEPGSSAPDKVVPLASLGVDSIALNFVPRGFPGACSLKMVKFFNADWWSASVVPDGQGTYDVTGVRQAASIFSGGPEHLLYVPEGSLVFGDRDTVLVSEYASSNIVSYKLDARGDPIPSTRKLVISGFPRPEGMTIDPVTGDLLVSNLGLKTIKRVTGFRPGPTSVALTPAAASVPVGQPATVTAHVTDPLGTGRAGVAVAFAVASGPNAGVLGACAPNADCTTDASGTVSFTYHGSGAAGTDAVRASFEAASCDQVTSQLASVTWAVNAAPVAEDLSSVSNEDTAAALTLLASDPDGDPLSFAIQTPPSHGTLSGTAPELTYTPAANYHGADGFTFTASDGHVQSNVATVSLTVTPVNDPPEVTPVMVAVSEDSPAAVRLDAVDVDGDALTFTVVTGPAHGTLSGTAPDLTYSPAPDYNGADLFTFAVGDGQVTTDAVAVTLGVAAVNDLPVAADQSVATAEDAATLVTLGATDVDGDALTFTVVAGPEHGTLSGTAPSLTYTPAPDYNGADSLTFRANDGTVDSNVAAVSLTVTPVNDPPTVQDQSLATSQGQALPVTLNGSDPDGDALTFRVVAGPAHGTLTGTPPSLTYTPAAGYGGSDGFTFRASDGALDSNVATVALTVTGSGNQSPRCSAATVCTSRIWPPNHNMRTIQVQGVTDPDGDPVSVTATGVWQDEPVNGLGDGDTSPDATLAPLKVRAERAGGGNGRVYHIDFSASDGRGGTCTGTVTTCVPKSQGGSGSVCVDGGRLYDSTQQ